MNLFLLIAIAIRALLRNKLRATLTTLGVVIGVGAVVAMTAIGAGARARVEQTFESMGSNMLIVRSGASSFGGMRGGAGSQPTLTWTDVEAIQALPEVVAAAPSMGKATQVSAEGQNWATQVQGTTPEFAQIRNWPVSEGRWFEAAEIDAGAKVAVVGQTVVTNLFGEGNSPLGQVLRVGQVPFTVIGVAESKGQAGPGGDQDDTVFIPISTFRAKVEGGLAQYMTGTLFVSAASREATSDTQAAIEALLRLRHRIDADETDDFSVRNLSDMAAAQEESAGTITALLAGIALVSLVVGGIGIMNIMLVSVTERTREIGLRMAVGAKPRHVLVQFLIEAVVLAVLGGFLGVAAGAGAGYHLASRFGFPMLISPDTVILAVSSSAIVGVVFGLWPAFRAARLDPIQALRFE